MYTDKQILDTLQKYADHAEQQGFKVYSVMLKGSQNYNLADEDSDIDANLVFIPTLQQLRTNEKIKFTFDEGDVTCHNIYSFAEIVAKGNPQWVEVCHTNYFVGEPLTMFQHYKVNPSALKGMLMEKVTAFSKLYPSRAHMIEKFGYDPKQLHHIIRLYDLLMYELPIYEYHDADRDWMMDIKRGRVPATLNDAMKLRDLYVARLAQIYESKKIAYKPQEVDYTALDAVVMKHINN